MHLPAIPGLDMAHEMAPINEQHTRLEKAAVSAFEVHEFGHEMRLPKPFGIDRQIPFRSRVDALQTKPRLAPARAHQNRKAKAPLVKATLERGS